MKTLAVRLPNGLVWGLQYLEDSGYRPYVSKDGQSFAGSWYNDPRKEIGKRQAMTKLHNLMVRSPWGESSVLHPHSLGEGLNRINAMTNIETTIKDL